MENDLAAKPSHYQSHLNVQCVPRGYRTHGAGYRKPAPVFRGKVLSQYIDEVALAGMEAGVGGGVRGGEGGDDAAGIDGIDGIEGTEGTEGNEGNEGTEGTEGTEGVRGGGGGGGRGRGDGASRRTLLVPRVVDAAATASQQMNAAALAVRPGRNHSPCETTLNPKP